MLEQGPEFHFRDKRLFEITEVKMARVDCMVKKSGVLLYTLNQAFSDRFIKFV